MKAGRRDLAKQFVGAVSVEVGPDLKMTRMQAHADGGFTYSFNWRGNGFQIMVRKDGKVLGVSGVKKKAPPSDVAKIAKEYVLKRTPMAKAAVVTAQQPKKLGPASLRFKPGEIWYERKHGWYFAPLEQKKNGNLQGLVVDLGDRNTKAKLNSIFPDHVAAYDVVEPPDYIEETFRDNPRFKG